MKIPVIQCEKAFVFPDATITDDDVSFVENDDYKFLSAFPLFEDGSYAPMASKDMKDWVMCIGAFVDGDPVDLLKFVKQIQEMVEKGGET